MVVVSLACVGLVSCSETIPTGDWTIDVPEDTRVIEYAAVPLEERGERIEFVQDLVLGADAGDPEQRFYRLTDVAIDGDGKMFVVDSGNHRVQVFDATGAFVTSLGREGQGPGEFSLPVTATVVGDRLLVSDRENVRLSVWSTDGTYLEDIGLNALLRGVSFVNGTDIGHAVVQYSPFNGPGTQSWALGALDLGGEVITEYVDLPLDRTPTVQRGARRYFNSANPRVLPSFAAGRDGNVYISPGDEYQVLALAPDGSARWALRVAADRQELSAEIRDQIREQVSNSVRDVTEDEINYIDRLPSISRMVVDGAGRLFVYPYVWSDPEAEGISDVPVDVYSADGERLFSGMIPNRGWRRAAGDFVYGAGSDRVTGEQRVFRWRLEGPVR